jgi:hypothetical protein
MTAAVIYNTQAASTAADLPAALVWFRSDLRLTDHEPLHSAATSLQQALAAAEGTPDQPQPPLLLPFYCLDERELVPRPNDVPEGGSLGITQLGPHRLR